MAKRIDELSEPTANPAEEAGPLSLWDAVSLIIGIVIGSSIYKTPSFIFNNVSGPWQGLAFWGLCGCLSFVSALCYAELATTYPRSGGEYNYLTRAFGSWAGFLFGWAQLAIIQTGSIGALSYVFAEYATVVFRQAPETQVWFAIAAVAGLTVLNMLGVNAGRHTQKILSLVKVLGLTLLIVAGLMSNSDSPFVPPEELPGGDWTVALILVLYAYGGWNDAAFVTSEVRDRTRNIPRALMIGLGLVTVLYVLVNIVYLRTLGFEGLRNSKHPAADASATLSPYAGLAMSVLVMVSALGGMNGLILAVSRVHATVGADHTLFALMGRWSTRTKTPVWSLLVQGIVTILIILSVGTIAGQRAVDSVVQKCRLPPISWNRFDGGFDMLFAASAPIFWFFFLWTGVAYFVLRVIDRDRSRPFAAPLFPLCPLIFCAMSVFGLYSSSNYAASLLAVIAVPFALGLPLFAVSQLLGWCLAVQKSKQV